MMNQEGAREFKKGLRGNEKKTLTRNRLDHYRINLLQNNHQLFIFSLREGDP
jgi:hypothetical protein